MALVTWNKKLYITLLILLAVYLIVNFFVIGEFGKTTSNEKELSKSNELDEIINFENFDHIHGHPTPIVPNIVHLLYLNNPIIDFDQMINIFSIFLNHGPDMVYFHCSNCSFTGKYFDALKANVDVWKRIVIHPITFYRTIFGQAFPEEWDLWIGSDAWRLVILMHYGGIYLDKDVFVVQSLKKYFHYEIVISWDKPFNERPIGSQILIANRDARLLKAIYDQFRVDYRAEEWYYNVGMVPAKILLKYPRLAHVVEGKLGTHEYTACMLFTGCDPNPDSWKDYSTIHTLIRHRYYLDQNSTIKIFDETNIWTHNRVYGRMCRDIMERANLFIPKNKPAVNVH